MSGARGRVKHATLREALLSRVEVRGDGECWPWTGAVGGHAYDRGGGYGVFSWRGVRYLSHRAAFEVATGEAPGKRFICHRCDNSRCCNPAHLFAGSHQDNVDDAVSKRRHTHADSHPMRKLSGERARLIRTDARHPDVIAAAFGISRAQVYNVKSGKSWRTP